MNKNIIFLALLAAAVLLVCIRGESAQLVGNCPDKVALAKITRLNDSWDLEFIKKSKVLSKEPFTNIGGWVPGLTSVQYKIKKRKVIAVPRITANSCEASATLDYWYLLPDYVIGLEKNDHLFAYQILAQLLSGPKLDSPRLGAKMNFFFYDTQGKGKFDMVDVVPAGKRIEVPNWVQHK